MSIKIHYGPNGSFKTAGAVTDDLIPAILAGRVIVTNVRGVTRERCLDVFPDAPQSLEVINIPFDTAESREQWAKWFHWVPIGAFIIMDEVQSVWPKAWRESDLKALDFSGGPDASKAAGRPATFADAFYMHRHYNWDIILTTPDIRKVRDELRAGADMAFKHKDLGIFSKGILGSLFKGKYVEASHTADDTGANANDFITVQQKRIKDDAPTWKLYDSTSTGVATVTKSSISLFGNTRLVMALVFLAGAVAFLATHSDAALHPIGSVHQANIPTAQTPVALPPQKNPPALSADGANRVVLSQAAEAFPVDQPSLQAHHPFEGFKFIMLGAASMGQKQIAYFELHGETREPTQISSLDLVKVGYTVEIISGCSAIIKHGEFATVATCGASLSRSEAQAERRPNDALNATPPASPPVYQVNPS